MRLNALSQIGISLVLLSSHLARAESAPVKTAVEMKVVGVLAVDGGRDRRSSAMIGLSKNGGKVETYYPGQSIGGDSDLKLVHVGSDQIEFLNRGKLEFATVKHFPDYSGSSSTASTSLPESKSRDESEPLERKKPTHIPRRPKDKPEDSTQQD